LIANEIVVPDFSTAQLDRPLTVTLELDSSLRVTPSLALLGDLKALLGPGCVGG
jgi:DNA polymerase-3 subunit alpha